jgi:hemoglobin
MHSNFAPLSSCGGAQSAPARIARAFIPTAVHAALLIGFCAMGVGCGSTPRKKDEFFTSGSREADQRAGQKMAQAEQLSGSGEGGKPTQRTRSARNGTGADTAQIAEEKLPLFDRLGGELGLKSFVDDLVPRVLKDPRVNWARLGVKRGGLFRTKKDAPDWTANPANISLLKTHFVQFLALATGGPAKYDGRDLKILHQDMRITNPEFDAVIGDAKASLDKLQVANREQKELLAIIESTRPLIVTVR